MKKELKREEEESRQREGGLYSMIIELQIENANLKGEKETLSRIVSRRDKMLLELRMQLQAMEFVCRENDVKIDIDMCSDEVIENWSFKESDECYQRILLSTQDMLRAGSKCIEENMPMGRSSSQQPRSIRSPKRSLEQGRASPASLSDGARSVAGQDRGASPIMFKDTSRAGSFRDLNASYNSMGRSIVSQSNLAEIDAGIKRDGHSALDCVNPTGVRHSNDDGNGDCESDVTDDDDNDEGQESEFEELGEDMIKYVELQSVGRRRESRGSSSMPKNTPDMAATVLMKNVCAPRRSGSFPVSQQQQHYARSKANRSSGGSILSNSSLLDDYFTKARRSTESRRSTPSPRPGAGGHIGLGLIGINRSPEQMSMERFLSAPPLSALPASPSSVPSSATSSHFFSNGSTRSPPSSNSSAVFLPNYGLDFNPADCPPPMMPLPPLPDTPRYSFRDHMKQKLLQFKRPTHARTSSHGLAIEGVNQFVKRKNYGKELTRNWMHHGHRRRDSV